MTATTSAHSLTGEPTIPGIIESTFEGCVVLSPARRPLRRVLFVNSYGGADAWKKIKAGFLPPHHLWGCLELVRLGYEVLLAEPLPHFNPYRRQLPHDFSLLKVARNWLKSDDIIYCGHTLLYWLPLLKALRLLNRPIVSLTYAREELDFARSHTGIIALTPAAEDQAKKMAPKVKVIHLGWGVDLGFFPKLNYVPGWFLSCGKTHRDHRTLSRAAELCKHRIRVISPQLPEGLAWPASVSLVTGGKTDDTVSYAELLNDYYSRCSGSLIILNDDPTQYTAVGFTNLIEAMAMARPVIVTNTGALPTEINVENAGCGLQVPSNNPVALAEAITSLNDNPRKAEAMGIKGRELCESHYNIGRYASGLHRFFESF